MYQCPRNPHTEVYAVEPLVHKHLGISEVVELENVLYVGLKETLLLTTVRTWRVQRLYKELACYANDDLELRL